MKIFDKLKTIFASDDELIARQDGTQIRLKTNEAAFALPASVSEQSVYDALVAYGQQAGYINPNRKPQPVSDALLASVRNQTVKMHEEILKCYQKSNQTPDEKLLNRLTIENMFFLAMGTAILAKVRQTNLIAQGFFGKLLRKSGPEFFYREVLSMAGHKYGSQQAEDIHQHVQRATYQLLISFDAQHNSRTLVIECAKAMYMYGLAVTLKEKN